MARTKTKSSDGSKTRTTKGSRTVPVPTKLPEVLTLTEAAAYLRVSEQDVLRAVGPEGLPGRMIGGEWRFLKPAVEDWLQTAPKPSSREALLSLAGAWKDDPYLDEMLDEIYRQRGRPMTEDEE